jgi:sortase (surface protein transpeptidase)
MTTPDDLTVLYPTTDERLTLITCDSYDFLQDAYLERMVVIADRIA